MDEGVSIADENGNILFTNAAEDKMFGYKGGELIGKNEGTGLGLALCKKIVDRYNGEIKAYGKEDVGATVEIFLPINVIVIDGENSR